MNTATKKQISQQITSDYIQHLYTQRAYYTACKNNLVVEQIDIELEKLNA